LFSYLVMQLRDRYPDLAYLHVIEKSFQKTSFIWEIWNDRPLISAGGYTRKTALAAAEEKGDAPVF
ncbi:hypothetical protein FB45DRAFT_672119, partial [Roridomyces roridus]